MLPRLPNELLDAILAKTTVGSRARLAAACQPLRNAVRQYETETPATRLDALRGSDEVLLDLFRFVDRSDDPRKAARSFDLHKADTGVTFTTPEPVEGTVFISMWFVTDRYARGTVFGWISHLEDYLHFGPPDRTVVVTIDRIAFNGDNNDGSVPWSLDHVPVGMFDVARILAAARKLLTLFPDSGQVCIRASALTRHPDEDFLWEFKEKFAAMVPALLDSGLFVYIS